MSLLPTASAGPCLYTYDRERSCGGVVQYNRAGEKILSSSAPSPRLATPLSGSNAGDTSGQASDSVGFGDFVDMINPLQHLPVIGWAYRRLTGDTMKPVPAMIGGAIFGGGIGLLSSAVQEVVINQQEIADQATKIAMNNRSTPDGTAKDLTAGRPEVASTTSEATPISTGTSDVPRAVDIAWNTPPLSSTLHYARFNREQTAGSIAVYG